VSGGTKGTKEKQKQPKKGLQHNSQIIVKDNDHVVEVELYVFFVETISSFSGRKRRRRLNVDKIENIRDKFIHLF